MKHLARKIGALAAVTALALSACSSDEGEGEGDGDGGTSITAFTGATGDMSKNFNPFSPTTQQPTNGIIYEALVHYNMAAADAAAAEPTMVLAESTTWDGTGQVLTIVVRSGVTWSDGTPMTANDVAFTFNYLKANAGINTAGFDGTATAVDDTTVTVDFGAPNSYTLAPNLLGNTAIVPEHLWTDVADPTTFTNENPVGTGPFTLTNFTPQSYVLTKNANYWDEGKPAINEIRYVTFGNADAANTALLNGDIDWMSVFIPGLEQQLEGNPDITYVNNHVLTTVLAACSSPDLGCTGPQTDPAIRQAIYYALDRTRINAAAFEDFASQPSYTMMVPGRDDPWFAAEPEGLASMDADTATAEQKLTDAGWVKGGDGIYAKGGERASLTAQVVSGFNDYIAALQTMTEQLKTVGIELVTRQVSYNEWSANQNNGTFQLSMDSLGLGVTPNPFFVYEYRFETAQTVPVGTPANGNFGRYSNPTVDAAINAAGATNDEAVQKEQYGIIQAQLFNDMPYIPVVLNGNITEFNTSRATGWPLADNPYAFPASWKLWDNGIVAKTITPAG